MRKGKRKLQTNLVSDMVRANSNSREQLDGNKHGNIFSIEYNIEEVFLLKKTSKQNICKNGEAQLTYFNNIFKSAKSRSMEYNFYFTTKVMHCLIS